MALFQQSAARADSPEVMAQNVRLQIVELASAQFGPSLLNDWNHPKATYPTQADTYVMAFTRLMALELSAQRMDDAALLNVKTASTTVAGSLRFLNRVLGGTLGPVGDAVDYAASVQNRVSVPSRIPSDLFEAHLQEVEAVAQELLAAPDFQAYKHAAETHDYTTQTSLLYRVNYEVLKRQPVANPYVLWWCDMRGQDGDPGSAPISDEFFREAAAGDDRFKPNAWKVSTPLQKWSAVHDVLKHFFQQTSAALVDPPQRVSLLASVKPEPEVKLSRGSLLRDPVQINREYVAGLGPAALASYDHANSVDKSNLLRTAMLFVGGIDSLLPMLMGSPDLKVDGVVAPPAQRAPQ